MRLDLLQGFLEFLQFLEELADFIQWMFTPPVLALWVCVISYYYWLWGQ